MSETTQACRLYLVVPHGADETIMPAYKQILDSGNAACVLLLCAPGGCMDGRLARTFCEKAQARDIAFLVQNDTAAAREIGADGVHITGSEDDYRATREQLGSERIVGMDCGLDRHAALVVAEENVDYAGFSPVNGDEAAWRETIAWWAEIVEVPLVAFGVSSLEQARMAAELGADFAAVGDAIWDHPEGAIQGAAQFARALAPERSAA